MISRYPIDLILFVLVAAVQSAGLALLWTGDAARRSRQARLAIGTGATLSFAFLCFAVALRRTGVGAWFSEPVQDWVRGGVLMWALVSSLMVASLALSRVPLLKIRAGHSPARRGFLRTVKAGLYLGPAVATGYGVFIERFDFRLREQDIQIPNLPEDLDGLRLVQVTDIHLSPYLSVRDLERVIDMANETRADVALVTGDLITRETDPLDDCLDRLSRLRAIAGVYGCLGNHEIYAGVEDYVAEQGALRGIDFLRHRAEPLRFGNATLNLAGVDYQSVDQAYLEGAESLRDAQAFNVLLSHNPDVFPVAAAKGFPLTISGHTHGGQVRVEILRQDLAVARFLTPYVEGVYRMPAAGNKEAAVFVSRGIGTIGIPARLGAPPEVALIRLCRS